MKKLFLEVIFVFVVIAVCGASCMYLAKRWTDKPTAPTKQFTEAAPIPQAEKVKTVYVKSPPQIRTIEKTTVVHDLKLPDAIAKDPDKQITATAQVKTEDGNKLDSISVIDTKTGASEIETKTEKPFFTFLDEKELGMRAGMGLRGLEGAAYARWTFARTGNVHYGIYAEATSPPFAGASVISTSSAAQGDGKLMLDISYRW